jgi:hypothetical protein
LLLFLRQHLLFALGMLHDPSDMGSTFPSDLFRG